MVAIRFLSKFQNQRNGIGTAEDPHANNKGRNEPLCRPHIYVNST